MDENTGEVTGGTGGTIAASAAAAAVAGAEGNKTGTGAVEQTPEQKAAAEKTAADAKAAADAAMTPEQKAAAEKAATDKAAADAKAKGPPEKYDFKATEGVTLDPEAVKAFEPVARELGLTQDQAQKLVELHATTVSRLQDANAKAWETTQDSWRKAFHEDPEIGGANETQTLVHVAQFINTFGGPKLVEVLDATGTGDHPEFIRAMSKAGKAMAEAKMFAGNSPAQGGKKTQAEIMYPAHPSA